MQEPKYVFKFNKNIIIQYSDLYSHRNSKDYIGEYKGSGTLARFENDDFFIIKQGDTISLIDASYVKSFNLDTQEEN